MIKSIGTAKVSGEEYVVMIVHQKTKSYYYLLSQYHRDDQQQLIFGGDLAHPVRTVRSYAFHPVDNNYISAVIRKSQVGGDMQYYGMYQVLLEIIDAIQNAVTYAFRQQDILLDDHSVVSQELGPARDFIARDENLEVEYRKVGGLVQALKYKSATIEIEFTGEDHYHYPKTREVKPLLADLTLESTSSRLYCSSIKTIDYRTVLSNMPSHDWYVEFEEDGSEIYHKDYREIQNKEDFERHIVLGLVNEIKAARKNKELPVLVSLDTETTGLDLFAIPSEYQSRVVAIPLSFVDDEGFVIFTEMEYFDNIPIEYVKERLEPFLSKKPISDDEITIQTIEGPFSFRRSELFLVGHNTMFDIRAMLRHNTRVWFDADTMQMSFNLDPFLTKRKNSLKYITHKLCKCWTPELTDVLGAGNEDKFKFLSDLRLIRLYGGADADFSRLVFKALKRIYKECEPFHKKDLFKTYLEQDVIPMNLVAEFDFNGVRVDRERFNREGEVVKRNIERITAFAHEYVGRVVAANNYLQQRQMIVAGNQMVEDAIAAIEREGAGGEAVAAQIAELKSHVSDPNSLPEPDLAKAPPYKFKFAGNDLITVLFDLLKYPVLVWTDPPKPKKGEAAKAAKPRPAVNETAMKKLMEKKTKYPLCALEKDILGEDGATLISAEEFNSFKYPVAYLVSLIGPRKKEYDSYFAAFERDSFGDRLCKDSKFASIDTRRIANPLQTIKGSLKQYVWPEDDTYAMCDFDMSQVELRIMASIASDEYTCRKMDNPEVDAHTECASDMSIGVSKFHKAAYLISAYERKIAKPVNFGYPYGLSPYTMCEQIFGEITNENLAKTHLIIESFEKARHKIVTFLNAVREQTRKPIGTCDEEPIAIPLVLREYLEIGEEIPVGIVRNLKGFYKLFQLNDMDERKIGRINRQSGNFVVQSFAAELFRIVLIRLFLEFYRLEWFQKKWVKGHLLIHDEFLFSFKKKHIHPVHLITVLYRCCTVKIKGHATYYIGINIGDNWGDCKDDASELPVYCVERLLKRWENGEFDGEVVDDPKPYMMRLRQEYISDRILEVASLCAPDIAKEKVDCAAVLSNFENYTVRKYVYECYEPLWTVARDSSGKMDDIAVFDAKFARWALHRFGDGVRFITSDHKDVILNKELENLLRPAGDKLIPYTFEEMFEGKVIELDDLLDSMLVPVESLDNDTNYYKDLDWSLCGETSFFTSYGNEDDEESFEDIYDMSAGDTVETMRRTRPSSFENFQLAGSRLLVKVLRKGQIRQIETAIGELQLESSDGLSVFYLCGGTPTKGRKIMRDRLIEFDKVIAEIKGG